MSRSTIVALLVTLCAPTAAGAAERCYELSRDGKAWSRTPEVLCVEQVKDKEHHLTFRTGLPNQKEVGKLRIDLLSRAKCPCHNEDLFGVANPSNSILNELKVKFSGARDTTAKAECGMVAVGTTRFFYRLQGGAKTCPTPPKH